MSGPEFSEHSAAIWRSRGEERPDRYVIFRKKFELPPDFSRPVRCDIAADSSFELRINGVRVPAAQAADFPEDRSCSSLDVSALVRPGANVIAVEVHYLGDDFLTRRRGTAFLRAAVYDEKRVYAATGSDWKWSFSPDMISGAECKLTKQLGYVFCCDARRTLPWGDADLDDSAWKNAVVLEHAEKWRFSPRDVPQLRELPPPEVKLVQTGYLKRLREEASFARTAYRDYLSPRSPREFFAELDADLFLDGMLRSGIKLRADGGAAYRINPPPADEHADGCYIIVDLGRETVGYLTLDLTAPAGTVVDICHGEHLDDGRVRASVRNFADRLICREGRNRLLYTHRRVGCRYVELHITRAGGGELALRYVGVAPLELPLPECSRFFSEDRLLSRLDRLSAATLKLCMHEHYEDCPWREQALYAYDSRAQMLYGYQLWGNYDFAAASLDLLGKSFDVDRYLALTSPGAAEVTIPIFTLVWITALYEHYLYSGSAAAFKHLPIVDRIVDRALAEPSPGNRGLYSPGSGKHIWNFCEWNGELSRLDREPQAPYNIYLCEALRAAAKLNLAAGDRERGDFLLCTADSLGQAVERTFYDPSRGCYDIGGGAASAYEHIQAIMLANDLVPAEKREGVLRAMSSGNLREIGLNALNYLVDGLMKTGADGRKLLTGRLRNLLEPMALAGATSLWETCFGGDDFNRAGSLCHGWSCVIPYFCRRCILGVTPLAPGFAEFEVRPYPADLSRASGFVPTPRGEIRVEWQKNDAGLRVRVEHPAGLKCVPAQCEEAPVAEWKIEIFQP